MYKVEKKKYGLKVQYSGFLSMDEVIAQKEEIYKIVNTLPDKIGVLIDMREIKPLSKECQEVITDTQKMLKSRLNRSATIVANTIVKMQFKRLSKDTGVADTKKFIDGSKIKNWEKVAEDWIVDGMDPDMHD